MGKIKQFYKWLFNKCDHKECDILRQVPNIGFPDMLTTVLKCRNCKKVQTEVWQDNKSVAVFSPF